jgi:hypothetical protein
MASMEFDFPEPLGPMIDVKYESPNCNTWCPLYDLKLNSSSASNLPMVSWWVVDDGKDE